MFNNNKVGVVIPCYKVEKHIRDVVSELPDYIDHIILVNDCSPDNTETAIEVLTDNQKVIYCKHKQNQGVGGAMITGFRKALELNCDLIVKMDGDGQMDPAYLPELLDPVSAGVSDFSKGNRFHDLKEIVQMPLVRRIGNLGLSFLIKAASGYWHIFDPTNGYFCISARTLQALDFDRLEKRYFFESSLLIGLYYTGARIEDVPIPARYGDEESNLSVTNTLLTFPPKLLKALIRRVLLRYFIFDFNIFSIYLIIGVPLLLFGIIFGTIKWIKYATVNVPAPTGTVMLATLSVVLGVQLLLAIVQFDISAENPFKKKQKK